MSKKIGTDGSGGQGEIENTLPGMGSEREPGNSQGNPPRKGRAAHVDLSHLTPEQRAVKERQLANLHGGGRKPGQQNRLTVVMKNAIEEAFEKAGGVEYLVRIANGNTADRTAFMALLGRLLPMQVNSNIDQRIRVELPWLAQRTIGKTLPSDAALLANAGKAAAEGRIVDADPPEGGE